MGVKDGCKCDSIDDWLEFKQPPDCDWPGLLKLPPCKYLFWAADFRL